MEENKWPLQVDRQQYNFQSRECSYLAMAAPKTGVTTSKKLQEEGVSLWIDYVGVKLRISHFILGLILE